MRAITGDEMISLHVLSDLSKALMYMHLDKDFVHGDIKPANIAYYRGHWCLIDLDISRKIGSSVNKFSGTIGFLHPSAFHDRDHLSNPSSDLFFEGNVGSYKSYSFNIPFEIKS